jgi:hypothetical protein
MPKSLVDIPKQLKCLSIQNMKQKTSTPDKLANCAQFCQQCREIELKNQQLIRRIKRLNKTLEANQLKIYEKEMKDIIKNEWRQLAIIIDRLMLYVFMLLTLIVLITLFNQLPSH